MEIEDEMKIGKVNRKRRDWDLHYLYRFEISLSERSKIKEVRVIIASDLSELYQGIRLLEVLLDQNDMRWIN